MPAAAPDPLRLLLWLLFYSSILDSHSITASTLTSIYSRSYPSLLTPLIDQQSFIFHHQQITHHDLINGINAIYSKDFHLAHLYFDKILRNHPTHVDALYNKGVAYQLNGDAYHAIRTYHLALKYNPYDLRIRLNLAAVNQLRGNLTEAIEHYRIGLSQSIALNSEMRIKYQTNLASSLYQDGRIKESFETSLDLLRYLQMKILDTCSSTNLETCHNYQANFDNCLNNFLNSQRSVVYLQDQEYHLRYLLYKTLNIADSKYQSSCIYPKKSILQLYPGMENSITSSGNGPILPFDSLQYEISLCLKLAIAVAKSSHLISTLPAVHHLPPSVVHEDKTLRLGFISHDFCDHPTAHLLEGILALISLWWENSSTKPRITLFSYGPNDQSIYRKRLQQYADQFFELVYFSDADAVRIIQSQDLDILLDMQLYTLGHRFEITARQPVSLQVNYLVYPGTSGAPFLQYLVADHIVTPPEQSQYYSESLILLPPPYQVSFYGRYDMEEAMRNPISFDQTFLPKDSPYILVNFNKLDKLDIDSLQVWGQIMARYPKSNFLLLNPSGTNETTDKNIFSQTSLLQQFNFRGLTTTGISSQRITFAERCTKEEHIRRHQHGDLFLDSMIYGAHSTATDALKGGLPVITLQGNSFPSRVASSLLSSFDSSDSDTSTRSINLPEMLITYSKKSYEDHVIRLLKSPHHLTQLRQRLSELSHISPNSTPRMKEIGLFNTTQLVRDFLSGMYGMREAQDILAKKEKTNMMVDDRYPHLIVTRG